MDKIRERLSTLSVKDTKTYLNEVQTLVSELEDKKESLKAELYFQEFEIPIQCDSLEKLLKEIEELIISAKSSAKNITNDKDDYMNKIRKNAPKLASKLNEFSTLGRLAIYFNGLEKLAIICSDLGRFFGNKSWKELLVTYKLLQKLSTDLADSKCENFVTYLNNVTETWREYLKDNLKQTVITAIEQIGWPFDKPRDFGANADEIEQFQSIVAIYHTVHPKKSLSGDENKDNIWTSDVPIIELLMEPFRKRFHYHFYGDKKTNAPDKPEWFFTQILQWAQIHKDFIDDKIQYILYDSGYSACLELSRALMGLATEKVRSLSTHISDDPTLFTHILDETVVFELEMAESVGYPENEPNCLDLFAEDSLVKKWIEMEHNCNTEKAEELLTNPSAWIDRYEHASDLDEFKVPECADDFMLLLQLITERYRLIRSISGRAKFLQLQLELLDDFRVRLLQIQRNTESPWKRPYPELMNAAWYLAHVLRQWGDLPFFIQLHAHRAGISSSKNIKEKSFTNAFDSMVNLFQLMWNTMRADMTRSLVDGELRSALEPYRKERWYSTDDDQSNPTNISASFCPFLLQLSSKLTFLQEKLNKDGFRLFLKRLNESVAELIVGELLSQMSFSGQGGAQMMYDITSALIPLLCSYQESSSSLAGPKMRRLIESLQIISLPVPAGILLSEALKKMPDNDLLTSLGDDFEIFNIDRKTVEQLLKQRVDLTTGNL